MHFREHGVMPASSSTIRRYSVKTAAGFSEATHPSSDGAHAEFREILGCPTLPFGAQETKSAEEEAAVCVEGLGLAGQVEQSRGMLRREYEEFFKDLRPSEGAQPVAWQDYRAGLPCRNLLALASTHAMFGCALAHMRTNVGGLYSFSARQTIRMRQEGVFEFGVSWLSPSSPSQNPDHSAQNLRSRRLLLASRSTPVQREPKIPARKLTLTPRGKNFESGHVWGPGDFGS